MPNLYIIAGCNGAGKTTASYTILPEILKCKEFVNADNIAAGISPFNPTGVAVAAERTMLYRIDELMNKGVDFAFEITASHTSLIKKARALNYKVSLVDFRHSSQKKYIQSESTIISQDFRAAKPLINLENMEFCDKIMIGLKRALRKLAEDAASKNECLIVGDKDGNVKSVPAKELLKTLSK